MLNGFGCFPNTNANFANDANFADQVAKWSQEPKMPRKLLVDDSSDLSESDPEPVDSEQGYETATVKDTDTDTDSSDGVGVADEVLDGGGDLFWLAGAGDAKTQTKRGQ